MMMIMIQRIKLDRDHGWSLRLYWLLGTQFFIDFMEYFHVIGIPIKMIILVVTHRINTIFLLSSIRKGGLFRGFKYGKSMGYDISNKLCSKKTLCILYFKWHSNFTHTCRIGWKKLSVHDKECPQEIL